MGSFGHTDERAGADELQPVSRRPRLQRLASEARYRAQMGYTRLIRIRPPRDHFVEIMEMLDKRLNDKGKNWRHVFKVGLLTRCPLSLRSANSDSLCDCTASSLSRYWTTCFTRALRTSSSTSGITSTSSRRSRSSSTSTRRVKTRARMCARRPRISQTSFRTRAGCGASGGTGPQCATA